MRSADYTSLHHHLVLEIRRRAEQSGGQYANTADKTNIYAKAIAAAESLKEPGDLVTLHKIFGSDFGTILHTAVASYVRDRE